MRDFQPTSGRFRCVLQYTTHLLLFKVQEGGFGRVRIYLYTIQSVTYHAYIRTISLTPRTLHFYQDHDSSP